MSSGYFWFDVFGIAAIILSIFLLLAFFVVLHRAVKELRNTNPPDLPIWMNSWLDEEGQSLLICFREEWIGEEEKKGRSENRIRQVVFLKTLKYLIVGFLTVLRRDLLPSDLFTSLGESFGLIRITIVQALPIYPQLLILGLPNLLFSLWSAQAQEPTLYYGLGIFLVLVAPCIDGAMTIYAYQSIDSASSTPGSLKRSLRYGIARMPQYCLVILLLFIYWSLPVALLFVGFLLGPLAFLLSLVFVLPALGLFVILVTISPVAIIVENLSAAESLGRCLRLVKGQFWYAAIALVVGVLVFDTLIGYQIDRSLLRSETQDGASTVKSVLSFLFSPLSSMFAVVLFRSLRPSPQRQNG